MTQPSVTHEGLSLSLALSTNAKRPSTQVTCMKRHKHTTLHVFIMNNFSIIVMASLKQMSFFVALAHAIYI